MRQVQTASEGQLLPNNKMDMLKIKQTSEYAQMEAMR